MHGHKAASSADCLNAGQASRQSGAKSFDRAADVASEALAEVTAVNLNHNAAVCNG